MKRWVVMEKDKEQLLLEKVRRISQWLDQAGSLDTNDLKDLKTRLVQLESMIMPTKPRPSEVLQAQRAAVRRIVEAHRACNPRVFGSVAQGNDTEESDLDILIDPTPDTTLLDIGAILHELRQLLGVPVDVLTPRALPEKFRNAVLAEAIPI